MAENKYSENISQLSTENEILIAEPIITLETIYSTTETEETFFLMIAICQ